MATLGICLRVADSAFFYIYIDYIVTLINNNEQQLLRILFGFDGTSSGFSFKPLISARGEFDLSTTSAFLFICL